MIVKITPLKLLTVILLLVAQMSYGQQHLRSADSLRNEGYLMPALLQYAQAM
ncbi:MAG: hypothetical protein AAFZ63_24070 [Bacteroidota bacterium]